ncbi:MAG: HAD-IIIC family phosphatase, partial [Candidatus Zixiibacteriota bacterium]
LDAHNNIFLLDTEKWVSSAGRNAHNPKLWYLGRIPFSNDVYQEAMLDIKAAVNSIEGKAKKVIVVDLDDTLWGGIVGDVGWENIRLGGHDPLGEAFQDFQTSLKALTNRGILLAIVSKNDESIAMTAIKKHPEMVLRPDDFAGWRINWNDKAKNLAELVGELNLGLESVVFIDDNPVERSRVRESFPEVLVPEMPEDKLLFPSALKSLRCFDSPTISDEDRNRTEMYQSAAKRKSSLKGVESIDKWLKGLKTKVTVEPLNKVNLERTAQLSNKTNQMNLSTRRMSAAELKKWSEQKSHELWTIRVEDKFGDTGLVGILGLEFKGKAATIVDFVLSCRVMGRKIEETLAHVAVVRAKKRKATEIRAKFLATEQNKPCFEFWQRSGFVYDRSTNEFSWKASKSYALPEAIKIEMKQKS